MALAVLLSACAGRGPIGASPAAQIGDRVVSVTELDRYHESAREALELLERREPDQVMAGTADRLFGEHTPRGVPAEGIRSLLTELVRLEILRSVADDLDVTVGDADFEAFRDQFDPADLAELPETYTDVIIEIEALSEALGTVTEIDDDAMRTVFEDQKAGYTQVCLSILAVDDERAADDAVSRLRSGDPFEAVHTDLNSLPDPEGLAGEIPCRAAADLEPELGPSVHDVEAGDVLEPIRADEDLWIVALVRDVDVPTLDDLAPQLADTAPARYVDLRIRAAIDRVHINPRYGVWNPASGTVDPIPSDAGGDDLTDILLDG